jgi:acyl carrier protein
MGMDGVEIVMRIEEEFGIDLPDGELASIRTVGDLYQLILTKLEIGDSNQTSQSFYRLRRAMMRCLGLPRSAITPKSRLKLLMPPPTRAAAWKSLEEVSELTFPPLRHPRWARDTIRVLAVAAGLAFLVVMMNWTHPSGLAWLPLFLAACLIVFATGKALYAVTSALAREFPARTAGELAQLLLATNFSKFGQNAPDRQPISRRDVWQELVYILGDQQGLNPEQIVPEARLIEDLGID